MALIYASLRLMSQHLIASLQFCICIHISKLALLKKQKLVLTAISELTAQAPVIPTLPEQKPYGISIYDGWLKSLDDIRSEINTNQEHRASQKVVTVAAINQLETTRKGIRKINEAPPIAQTDAQLRRARLEEATANAWWQLSKMQEYLLQLKG